jgi:plasmid stabilization system protein ParE
MILSVSPETERELIDGAVFYAREASTEIGMAFIAEFERTLGVLCDYPKLGPLWRGTIRRMPLRRFPYSVIYQVRGDEIRVVALAHQRRKPGYWRGRR